MSLYRLDYSHEGLLNAIQQRSTLLKIIIVNILDGSLNYC